MASFTGTTLGASSTNYPGRVGARSPRPAEILQASHPLRRQTPMIIWAAISRRKSVETAFSHESARNRISEIRSLRCARYRTAPLANASLRMSMNGRVGFLCPENRWGFGASRRPFWPESPAKGDSRKRYGGPGIHGPVAPLIESLLPSRLGPKSGWILGISTRPLSSSHAEANRGRQRSGFRR